MYLNILKKDLRRKRAMNAILLIFLILASTFIASSVNNILAIRTATEDFFEISNVPDYWVCLIDEKEEEKFWSFAAETDAQIREESLLNVNLQNPILVNGEKLSYSGNFVLTDQERTFLNTFAMDNGPAPKAEPGQVYLPSLFCRNNGIEAGDILTITYDRGSYDLRVAGTVKDALFGSSMIGMTRGMIHPSDFRALEETGAFLSYASIGVYTDDAEAFREEFLSREITAAFQETRENLHILYIMDMIKASVLLIVSVCLILISLVILRFTISFTIQEDFREIGVMKAIGIPIPAIRLLYAVKYLAIALAAGAVGFGLSIPFGRLMLREVSQNMVLRSGDSPLPNLLSVLAVIAVVLLFCYHITGKVKHFSPVDAIRGGSKGERFRRKGLLCLNRSRMGTVPFLALNDIFSSPRRFLILILIFTLGFLLVTIPVTAADTLKSDHILAWFSSAPCDAVLTGGGEQRYLSFSRENIEADLQGYRDTLQKNGIEAQVFSECLFKLNLSFGDRGTTSLSNQGIGGVSTEEYTYLEGTAPQRPGEVAITHIIEERLDAHIGDEILIKVGAETQPFLVTAIYQSMNNMGEGVRFHQDEELDYSFLMGTFGIQIRYLDGPEPEEREARMELLREIFPDFTVFTAGEYINDLIGDIGGQMEGVTKLILIVVLCINVLVTILMEKTFLTKERSEIALLKALGFRNGSLVCWQALRIGLVLALSILLGALLSSPVAQLTVGPVFKMMGAANIALAAQPIQVFVLFPVLLFTATVLSALLTALGIRRVLPAETANLE